MPDRVAVIHRDDHGEDLSDRPLAGARVAVEAAVDSVMLLQRVVDETTQVVNDVTEDQMANPSPCLVKVISALVFISSALKPACSRISDSAMVKQPAWAPPINSSGLVPGLPSKRLANP